MSQEPHNGVDEARKHLMQSANLYNMCIKAVEAVIRPQLQSEEIQSIDAKHESITFVNKMTPEMFQAAVGTLFIEGSRSGMVSKMPEKPL